MACLGYWRWNRVTTVTVQAVSRRLRLIGLLADLARPFRPMPQLPKLGSTIAQWVLVPVAFREPRHLTPLVREVNNRAVAQGADQLLAATERGSGLISAMQGLFRVGVDGCVYVKPLQPLELGERPVWISGVDL